MIMGIRWADFRLYSIADNDQQAVAEDLFNAIDLSSNIIQACWINNLKDRF